jgi:3-deoxy-D-manno-octulosonic-acid transferase
VLQLETHARRARTVLVNAPLAATSSRLRPLARRFLAPLYAAVDAVGAVAAEDMDRFALLGVRREALRVTGDARFDQAWARAVALNSDTPLLLRLRDGRRTIVAGSTWPADEARLIPAFTALRATQPARLIVAPHEPTPSHLDALEAKLRTAGLASARLTAIESGTGALPEVVVVERVGVLAELYAVAHAAYVGGGFGRRGLHSVIEPAALGVPVVFGPYTGNAREALDLAGAAGGVMVHDAAELSAQLAKLLADGAAGRAARAFVEGRRGGAARNAALIGELLYAGAADGRTAGGPAGRQHNSEGE